MFEVCRANMGHTCVLRVHQLIPYWTIALHREHNWLQIVSTVSLYSDANPTFGWNINLLRKSNTWRVYVCANRNMVESITGYLNSKENSMFTNIFVKLSWNLYRYIVVHLYRTFLIGDGEGVCIHGQKRNGGFNLTCQNKSILNKGRNYIFVKGGSKHFGGVFAGLTEWN